MQITSFATRPPHLIQTLEALAQRKDHIEIAQNLLDELSAITVLVAKKFTNDKTAEGIQEALSLTTGCISLGISQADIPDNKESMLNFLLQHGAEYVFQMGFRHIKALSSLPYVPFISDFDSDTFIQQRNIKALFFEICSAEPTATWTGDTTFSNELKDRKANQLIVSCAQWLRSRHCNGPIKDSDLDANAVIAITVIFAIKDGGKIVARTGQKEIESLVKYMRVTPPDFDANWKKLLKIVPSEFHSLLQERMESYRGTIIKKILSKAKLKTVITEIQDYYAGNELDIDYP
jgi:hypothetical protein